MDGGNMKITLVVVLATTMLLGAAAPSPADTNTIEHVAWAKAQLKQLEWKRLTHRSLRRVYKRAKALVTIVQGLPVYHSVTALTVNAVDALIASVFTTGTGTALCIADTESGDNPAAENPSTHASGLFQFMPDWWQGSWDPFDPLT